MSCCTQPKLPTHVNVTDITARDGFQNLKDWIPTEIKTKVLDLIVASGVTKVEATSFVSPKAIPQMADAAAIVAHMRAHHPNVTLVALAPNLRGVQAAAEAGVTEVSYIISASAAHNQANINRTHQASLDDLAAITQAFPALHINLSMPTVFGCPFTGETPIADVLWLTDESLKRGVKSVTLCDTIGVANPLQVQAVVCAVTKRFPNVPMSLHLHDTHGCGLANTYAALQVGVTRFETAGGGLGGCPFAPGAAGNTATEDMLNMLHRSGVQTGIDLEKYLIAVNAIHDNITPNLSSRLAKARSYSEFCFYAAALSRTACC